MGRDASPAARFIAVIPIIDAGTASLSPFQRTAKNVHDHAGMEFTFSWNPRSRCAGNRDHDQPEYALILPKLGSRLANSITSADIEAIHSEVGAEHPYAANDVLEIVRKMFNWGKVAGYVSKDLHHRSRNATSC